MNQINYETPVGCFSTWEEAMAACERADLDPCACIKPVPSFVDISTITEYGLTQKLSNAVRCF